MQQKVKNNISFVISFIGFYILISSFWNEHIKYLWLIGTLVFILPIIILYRRIEEPKEFINNK